MTSRQYQLVELEEKKVLDDINREIRNSSSALLQTGESEVLQFKYQHSVGHTGKVLCNDASDDVDWILSGGEDCTARLWHMNREHFQCYRLYLVIHHVGCTDCGCPPEDFERGTNVCPKCGSQRGTTSDDPPKVNSVAFAGDSGPAVTATTRGDIYITSIKEANKGEMSHHHISESSISDVRVKREQYKGADDWLLAVAAGNKATLTQISPWAEKQGMYDCENVAYFDHGDVLVKTAQHVPGKVETGAAVVTAAGQYLRLWALPDKPGGAGIELMKLLDPGGEGFNCFHLVESENQGFGWLAGGAGNTLNVWPLKDGKVYQGPDDEQPPSWPVQYEYSHNVKDVTISNDLEFVMVQRADMASELRQIDMEPSDPEAGAVQHQRPYLGHLFTHIRKEESDVNYVQAPGGHPGKLPTNEHAKTLCTIEHTVVASEMCMRNPKTGLISTPVVLLSFHDGTVGVWDLQGSNRGEQTAENRSMTYSEIITPVLIRLVTFVQVSSFAFGPATDFSPDVRKPIKMTSEVASLDVSLITQYFPKVTPAMLFLPEVFAVLGMMLVYLTLVFAAAPEKLTEVKTALLRTNGYRHGNCCSRLSVACVTLVRSAVGLFIGTCSTVLVVPMFEVCAKTIDCVQAGDKSQLVLAYNPDIQCFGCDHWKLVCVSALVVPIYFASLLPYAVVNGDSEFMRRIHLFSPTHWKTQAIRKATLMYQGPMHPECESIFVTRVAELVTKIALPVIVILAGNPVLQTVLIAVCGLGNYVLAIQKNPVVNKGMNAFLQGMQLFTFLCMCCGVGTVVIAEFKALSGILLLSAFVVTLVFIFWKISQVQATELLTEEMKSLGSS